MSLDRDTDQTSACSLDEMIESACETIAPLWPLDQFIAVNPFHGWRKIHFEKAAKQLKQLSGSSLYMPASYYREAWNKGTIQIGHLEFAIGELGLDLRVDECLSGLESHSGQNTNSLPMLSDILDSRRDLRHETAWHEVATRQISKFCAAWFDSAGSDWRLHKRMGLYADWKDSIRQEHGITLLMHDDRILQNSRHLPDSPKHILNHILTELTLTETPARELMISALLRINGWSSWCSYLRWQARLHGRDNPVIKELLAIRLAWEWLLDDGRRNPSSVWQRWKEAWTRPPFSSNPPHVLAVWQRAMEAGYQMRLEAALRRKSSPLQPNPVSAQMIFCIDVRSEVIRRAIETRESDIQTLGFAGFFGLPIAFQPLGTSIERPQLPGLFKPQYLVTESTGTESADQALAKKIRAQLSRRARTGPFQKMPASAFTLVETIGLGYLVKLLAKALPRSSTHGDGKKSIREKKPCRLYPTLPATVPVQEKADLVAGILKAMSLTTDFAPLVVLVGHGSKSTNNPHAAGLDCGACGGQTGEVNARLLARLLNDPELRQVLHERDLNIPDGTLFLPALHNTTTDEIVILDADDVPKSHRFKVTKLQRTLEDAGNLARTERAPDLGLDGLAQKPKRLMKAMRKRTIDWSQTRPEWGLAGNAAFIAAPRSRTLDLDLEGRVFLHEYNADDDKSGEILESIMTGPVVVATWINLQYYASTVDNKRFGSGNKVLHNVVGGHIGVFEGNGGDLRTGLPLQSLHDGYRWMHTPQRLSIYMEARADHLEKIMDKHSLVRELIENDWVFLFRIEPGKNTIEHYSRREWLSMNQSIVLR